MDAIVFIPKVFIKPYNGLLGIPNIPTVVYTPRPFLVLGAIRLRRVVLGSGRHSARLLGLPPS